MHSFKIKKIKFKRNYNLNEIDFLHILYRNLEFCLQNVKICINFILIILNYNIHCIHIRVYKYINYIKIKYYIA